MLSIAKLDRYDMVNNIGGQKPSFTIWFSGCSLKCAGCQNMVLWDKSSGDMMDVDDVADIVVNECRRLNIDTVVLLGGEPLDQDLSSIYSLCYKLRGLNIWMYTGHEFDDIPISIRGYLSIVKTGRYIEALKQDGFPSSSNQQLWENTGCNRWIKKQV